MNSNIIMENWRRHLNELDNDDTPRYDVPAFKTKIEIKLTKTMGGNKQETMAEIRAIPYVTVVSTEPGSVEDDETSSYITYNLAFVHNPQRFRTPKLQFSEVVKQIKTLKSVMGVRIVGDMEKKNV